MLVIIKKGYFKNHPVTIEPLCSFKQGKDTLHFIFKVLDSEKQYPGSSKYKDVRAALLEREEDVDIITWVEDGSWHLHHFRLSTVFNNTQPEDIEETTRRGIINFVMKEFFVDETRNLLDSRKWLRNYAERKL